MRSKVHALVRSGDLTQLRALLDHSPSDIHLYDRNGHTPLMCAVQHPTAGLPLTELLLERGARLTDLSHGTYEMGRSVLSLALEGGCLPIIQLLLDQGADPRYRHGGGYDALLDATRSVHIPSDSELDTILHLLISHGAPLNGVSDYKETAIARFSQFGRFAAVHTMINAGADPSRLEWSSLHRAIAFESLAEVKHLLDQGAEIEAQDGRERTPFLLATHVGDVAKTEYLLQRGANSRALGYCATPALHYAVDARRDDMVDWLVRIGADIEQTDQFGGTPLLVAAEYGDLHAAQLLIARGANLEAERNGQTALAIAERPELILSLLNAGANPAHLTHECQRIILGLGPISEDPLDGITKDHFHTDCSPRFGTANPERIHEPFWEAMIRAGVTAYRGADVIGITNPIRPVWCAQRFGQSLTRLPDGRIIQIGGEHEDSYDWNFCIYNDVFVHHPDGRIEIYGYPTEVFPPTDFHTATLAGAYIYVIGSAGYPESRIEGTTPVFRLHVDTFAFEQLHPSGSAPNSISGHRADFISAHEIRVTGGRGGAAFAGNESAYVLNIQQMRWHPADGPAQTGASASHLL